MPLDNREIERVLLSKFDFEVVRQKRRHRHLQLKIDGCAAVTTMLSHSNQTLSRGLESTVAKQLKVQTQFFREMIGCTKSREEYYRHLRNIQDSLYT